MLTDYYGDLETGIRARLLLISKMFKSFCSWVWTSRFVSAKLISAPLLAGGGPPEIVECSTVIQEKKMIRRFPPAAIAATVLALSLTASVSMAEDGHLGPLAQELKTALAADPVEVTQKGVSVMLTSSADAMFPSGGWQVPSSAPLLDKMLPTLSRLQHTNIVVAGYTDNVPVGEELKAKGVSNNLDLSAERAVSIANYLTSHGVKPDLVSAHGFGETNPVASNDTPEGQAKNRRVDITLTGDGT